MKRKPTGPAYKQKSNLADAQKAFGPKASEGYYYVAYRDMSVAEKLLKNCNKNT